MRKVLYSETSLQQIENYFDAYRRIFFDLYIDSGIEMEDRITEQYVLTSLKNKHCLFEKLIFQLTKNKVLGRKKLGDYFQISFILFQRYFCISYLDISKTERLIIQIDIQIKQHFDLGNETWSKNK